MSREIWIDAPIDITEPVAKAVIEAFEELGLVAVEREIVDAAFAVATAEGPDREAAITRLQAAFDAREARQKERDTKR